MIYWTSFVVLLLIAFCDLFTLVSLFASSVSFALPNFLTVSVLLLLLLFQSVDRTHRHLSHSHSHALTRTRHGLSIFQRGPLCVCLLPLCLL